MQRCIPVQRSAAASSQPKTRPVKGGRPARECCSPCSIPKNGLLAHTHACHGAEGGPLKSLAGRHSRAQCRGRWSHQPARLRALCKLHARRQSCFASLPGRPRPLCKRGAKPVRMSRAGDVRLWPSRPGSPAAAAGSGSTPEPGVGQGHAHSRSKQQAPCHGPHEDGADLLHTEQQPQGGQRRRRRTGRTMDAGMLPCRPRAWSHWAVAAPHASTAAPSPAQGCMPP